jgi:hypothetical protein
VCAARSRDGQGGRERRSRDGRFVETERERESVIVIMCARDLREACAGGLSKTNSSTSTHTKNRFSKKTIWQNGFSCDSNKNEYRSHEKLYFLCF